MTRAYCVRLIARCEREAIDAMSTARCCGNNCSVFAIFNDQRCCYRECASIPPFSVVIAYTLLQQRDDAHETTIVGLIRFYLSAVHGKRSPVG